MRFCDCLKMHEGQYMFIKWIGGSDYAKLTFVGNDFYQFDIVDIDTMNYSETIMMQHNLLLEVTFGGSDVQRVLAEMSCNLPVYDRD